MTRAEETRNSLLEAGIALFGRHGFDGVTTRELTDAAHANLSAIKYHFGGKDELYRAVMQQLASEISELIGPQLALLRLRVDESAGKPAELRACALEFAEGWCRAVLRDHRAQRRIPCVVRELSMPSRHFAILYDGFFRPLHASIEALVGSYRGQSPTDSATIIRAHAMAHILLGFVGSESVLWRRMSWKRYTLERIDMILETVPPTFVAALETVRTHHLLAE